MGFFNSSEDDVRAINSYFQRTAPKTAAAAALKKQWEQWFGTLNAISIKMDSTFQEATNRRNAFNVAQAQSPAEAQKTKDFIANAKDKEIRPDLYKQTDSAGNFPKQKGVTVASAAPGSIPNGARPTIRLGSQGESVREWQKILGLTADGIFGSGTLAATKKWQSERGLVADGVVGSASWAAAMGSNASNMPFAQAAVTPVNPVSVPASQAPIGTVAQIPSISKPKPTVHAPSPAVTPATVTASATPAIPVAPVKTETILTAGLDGLDQLPTWQKVVAGVLLFGGTTAAIVFGKDVHKPARRSRRRYR